MRPFVGAALVTPEIIEALQLILPCLFRRHWDSERFQVCERVISWGGAWKREQKEPNLHKRAAGASGCLYSGRGRRWLACSATRPGLGGFRQMQQSAMPKLPISGHMKLKEGMR